MCGRYRLTNAERYTDLNDVRLGGTEIPARFNIAPTQTVFVILDKKPGEFSPVKWGLIPSWSTDKKSAFKMINARGAMVASKSAFRDAFKKRRCLVPADGFFEWQKRGAAKQPFNIFVWREKTMTVSHGAHARLDRRLPANGPAAGA